MSEGRDVAATGRDVAATGRDVAERREGGMERDAHALSKRSLTVAGHRTSISLEDAFWSALRDIAATRGLAVAALVAEVDRLRGSSNLSSALRVFVLACFRDPRDPKA